MNLEKNAKKLKIALLVASLMLCVAVFPRLSYDFYVLLKWVVFGAAVYGALVLKDAPRIAWHFWPLVLVALVFNPWAPVSLTQLTWLIVDLGTATYFLTLSKTF